MYSECILLGFLLLVTILGTIDAAKENKRLCRTWLKRRSKGVACFNSRFKKMCPRTIKKACVGAKKTTKKKKKQPKKSKKNKNGNKDKKEKGKKDKKVNGNKKMSNKEKSLKDCCQQQDVDAKCIDACTFGPIDMGQIACRRPECGDIIKKVVYCISNGKNNIECCRGKKIPDVCNAFCNGQDRLQPLDQMLGNVGSALRVLPCIDNMGGMWKCHSDNYGTSKGWKKQTNWGPKESLPPLAITFAQPHCHKYP